jgi:hypothetical protein
MDAIGELLEPITTNLYAWRVPIAVASIVAVVLGAVIAARRGWLAAARRHPARTGVIVVIGLAIALPSGWYLGSPVFLRSSLVEAVPSPAPIRADPSTTPIPTATTAPSAATPSPTAPPTPTPTPFAPRALVTGEFSGTDEFHFGRGTATIIELEPGRYHLRLEDFSVRNGPDLFVYLSPDVDGYDDDALELGRLKATDGSFGYDLPEGADPSAFRSAIIWCKQFAHLFATAPFEAG